MSAPKTGPARREPQKETNVAKKTNGVANKILATKTAHLPVPLTAAELAQVAEQMGRVEGDLRAFYARKKEVTADLKAKEEALDAEMGKLGRLQRDKQEYRPVPVRVEADFRAGKVYEIREDTGETVGDDPSPSMTGRQPSSTRRPRRSRRRRPSARSSRRRRTGSSRTPATGSSRSRGVESSRRQRRSSAQERDTVRPLSEPLETLRVAYAEACEAMGRAHASGSREDWLLAVERERVARLRLYVEMRKREPRDRRTLARLRRAAPRGGGR